MTGGAGTGAITYSSGTPSVATVNPTTGEVTIVGAGTTVITATKAATATHAATTETYTVVIAPIPSIQSSTLASNNQYLDITFNQEVFTNSNGTGALTAADFAIAFSKNTGNATNVTIGSVTNPDGSPLVGGETTVRVSLAVTGTPNGQETIEIKPAGATSIYNHSGTSVPQNHTTNVIPLNGVYVALTSITSASVSNYGHGTKGQYFFGGIGANTSYTVTGQLYYSDIHTAYASAPIMLTATSTIGNGTISNIEVDETTGTFSFTYESGNTGSSDAFTWDLNGVQTSVFWTNSY